ncbi:MAG: hypothetical protein ACYCSR_16450, partial [Thiomonas sp.]
MVVYVTGVVVTACSMALWPRPTHSVAIYATLPPIARSLRESRVFQRSMSRAGRLSTSSAHSTMKPASTK